MAKFPMDLSKFKKVGADKKTTTLRHPDGHEVKIAHGALSPKMREQLHALPFADGGEVKKDSGPYVDPEAAKQVQKGATESGWQPDRWVKNIKDAFNEPSPSPKPKQQYADGGGVVEDDATQSSQQAQDSPDKIAADAGAPLPQQAPVVINVGGGNSQPQQNDQQQVGTAQMIGAHIGNAVRQAVSDTMGAAKTVASGIASPIGNAVKGVVQGVAGVNPQQQAQEDAADEAAQAKQPTQQPASPARQPGALPNGQPQPIGDPYGTQAFEGTYNKGLSEAKSGINQEAAANAQQGQESAQALQQSVPQAQERMKSYQDHYSELQKERQDFMQDIQNQHIDPQHYLNSMGTGQKIRTAVGLILGGFGALAGQENMAGKFLQDNINRDVEAQRLELGKKENLLSANLRQFGNLRDATEMTRAMQNDIVSQQLKLASANAATPMAKATALKEAGKLDMDSAQIQSQIAARKTLLGGLQTGSIAPEGVVRMLVPPTEQNAAYKELQSAQNLSAAKDNALSAFDQLSKINSIGNRVTSPVSSYKEVNAIKEPILAQLVKDSEGRITPQDTKMIEAFFPAPGDDAHVLATKRARMNTFISEKMHYPMLKAYGIDASSFGRYGKMGQSRIPEAAPILPSKK